MKNKKIEGYWYSELHKEFPMPVPNVLSKYEAELIYDLIKKTEYYARKEFYKGFANSRIEKSVWVGSAEFEKGGWIWPEGFAEHYVLKHRVKPTDDFLKFIGYIHSPKKEKSYGVRSDREFKKLKIDQYWSN